MTAATALALAALCCAAALGGADARVQFLETSADDRRVFHISSFGYERGGVFEMTVKAFEVFVPSSLPREVVDAKKFDMAYVLQHSESDATVAVMAGTDCFHRSLVQAGTDTVFEVGADTWGKNITTRYAIDSITLPGYYHLYFSNCEPQTQVHFSATLTQYNTFGGVANYLSAGESSLPVWFFLICAAFGAEAVVWIGYLRKHAEHVRSIHHLMTAVVVFKLASLLFESFEYHYIKTTGSPHGWNVVYYFFSFVKGLLFFAVIVLIGTGWSYLKPFLTERDKHVMLAILVVQAMVNLAVVVVDETSPGAKEFLTWRDIFHLLDMVCCCLILLPIVWSIRHLQESAEADGKAARNMERLKRFRKFYLLVVLFIYTTRIIVFLLSATLPFELVWLGTVFSELAALAFYATTGYLFRPQDANPYLAVGKDDEDEVEVVGGGRL